MPVGTQIGGWPPGEWIERRPRLLSAAIAVFLLLSVAFSLISQRGFDLRGDGAYYLAMQQAWLQGWPAIEPALRDALAQRSDIGTSTWYMLIEGADGRSYGIHFWFYSLLSAPFALMLSWLGLDPLLGFLAVNAILVAGAGFMLARSPALSPVAKLLIAISFGVTAVNWYAAWAHPEVFTASLLLIAAIAFLDRRTLTASLCIGAAALQNPSAALMLGALGVAALAEAWDRTRGHLNLRTMFDQGWRLMAGAAVAGAAPLFNLAYVGTLNPIVDEGFVRLSQLNAAMLGHFLFDLDQGAIIGFPFVFLAIVIAVALRVSRARSQGQAALIDRSDLLLLGALLITLPVLTQGNVNAGQYYVARYASWTLAPALVWLGRQYDRAPAPMAGAWITGLAIYAAVFAAFLGAKALYAAESRRDPSLPAFSHSFQFKPWTRILLDHSPALYNPWRGVFAERAIGTREVHEPRPRELPIIYHRRDGVITKVLAAADDPMRCEGGRFESSNGVIRITDARDGMVYLNGEMRCVAAPLSPLASEPPLADRAVESFRDCPDCPEMAPIPGQSFAAGRYEVTFAQWDACVAAGGCAYSPSDQGWGRGDRPVIHVSWRDVQTYLQWLSQRTGQRYRLLTSAEWDFAARAGATTTYSWGDQAPVCDESVRQGANFNACTDDRARPVGSFLPNAFGLHDVHGNVWEWVEDCSESGCFYRALRGGSWSFGPAYLASTHTEWDTAVYRLNDFGFRVARDIEAR